MSDGPPAPFNPTPGDHLNFASQTRTFRKDRMIRALGMGGIPTGGTNRPLYGIGEFTENLIAEARGHRQHKTELGEQLTQRGEMRTHNDGAVSYKLPDMPEMPMKHRDSAPKRPTRPSDPA